MTSVYHLCLQNGGEKGEGTLGLPPPKTGELPAHHVADLSTRVLFTRGGVMLLPRLFTACEKWKRIYGNLKKKKKKKTGEEKERVREEGGK